MAVDINNSWEGEARSDIRAFIQQQLKRGYVDVAVSTGGGETTITLTTAGGTQKRVSFPAPEGGGDGYVPSLSLTLNRSVYSENDDITFGYLFKEKYDGEEDVINDPSLTFELWKVTGSTNSEKITTFTTSNRNGQFTISSSLLQGHDYERLRIVGVYNVENDGVNYTNAEHPAQKSLRIASCSLAFADSFSLITQVKGYETTARTFTNSDVTYNGTYPGDVELYIDGVLKYTFTEQIAGRVGITYNVSDVDLSTGFHTCQVRAKMAVEGETDENDQQLYIYSNSLIWDFYKGITGTHVGTKFTMSASEVIANPITALSINTEQYITSEIEYVATSYDDVNGVYNDYAAVSVTKDNQVVNTLSPSPDEVNVYSFRDTVVGSYTLGFEMASNTRFININVQRNSANIDVASGALIDMSAAGRSNSESSTNIDLWPFRDSNGRQYTATLSDFTHINGSDGKVTDGWDGMALVHRNASAVTIPFAPFANFNIANGFYIEFTFSIDTVLDNTKYLIKCLNAQNKGGFYLKPEEAGIITLGNATVSTPFTPGKQYTLGFMIKGYQGGQYVDATGNQQDYTNTTTYLLELYVNGIRSAVTELSNSDGLDDSITITTSGEGAVWSLYGMRVYNTALTYWEILGNFITSLSDTTEILEVVNRNNVLNAAKTAISSAAMIRAGKNVLIIEAGNGTETASIDSDGVAKLTADCISPVPGSQRVISTKSIILDPTAQKKDNFVCKGLTFYRNGSLNDPHAFKTGPALLQVQGTSSTNYSRKNYDIFFAGQKVAKSDPAAWVAQFDDTIGVNSHMYVDSAPNKPRYKMSDKSQPVPVVCCKADYSDSSNLHNTVLTTLMNDVMFGLGNNFRTPPQYNNDTEYDDVRIGIEGYAIDIFVKDGDTEEYIGQYNMNNEKKDSHNVFGFDGTTGNPGVGSALCVEFLINNAKLTNFQVDSEDASFDWATAATTEGNPDIEFRYPSMDWEEAPVEAQNKVKRLFTWVADCHKAWRNSYSNVTGTYTSNKFVSEIKQYFKVENLLSHYLFTEYFMAVDQRSKNMMLASWGDHNIWYFIPYDSDTALGVTNDGYLILPWDSDENTPNPMKTNEYAFMGHDSYLWELVRYYFGDDTYTSNPEYGLQGCSLPDIAAILREESQVNRRFNMYNVKRAFGVSRNYWSEMAYNFDSDTKYIKPLTHQTAAGRQPAYAQFVQGARDAHRDWLLDRRFRKLDAKYACGYYLTESTVFYIDNSELENLTMDLEPDSDTYISFGTINQGFQKVKVTGGQLATITFSNRGGSNDPITFRGLREAHYINMGTIAEHLGNVINLSNLPKLRELHLNGGGGEGASATGVNFTGSEGIKILELKGYNAMTGIIDLSKMMSLEDVDINLENAARLILPRNTFTIKHANFNQFNIEVPFEFWDELYKRHYKPLGNSIYVAEMTTDDYTEIKLTSNYSIRQAGKYVVAELNGVKSKSGGQYTNEKIVGWQGNGNGNEYIKKIIYTVVDINKNDGLVHEGLQYLFTDCSNLESVETRNWNIAYADRLDMRINFITTKLREFDLRFLDTSISATSSSTDKFTMDAEFVYRDQNPLIEVIHVSSSFFNCNLQQLGNLTTLFAFKNLSKECFDELADVIPTIDTSIPTGFRRLYFMSNANNTEKIDTACRRKFENKGWLLTPLYCNGKSYPEP